TTGEVNFTPSSLEQNFAAQLAAFHSAFPSLPSPSSSRTHAIVWSDYSTQPQVELNHRIRLDENYYYWPGSWVQDRPGLFTGSGMPMRFATATGTTIDVYQAATQLTDESGQTYPKNINALLNNALGGLGYYGAFTANMHTDTAASAGSTSIVAAAQARGVPVVSGRQMLAWLDGRNGSSFGSIHWDAAANTLSFSVTSADGATGLQGMLPTRSTGAVLSAITLNGAGV